MILEIQEKEEMKQIDVIESNKEGNSERTMMKISPLSKKNSTLRPKEHLQGDLSR